MNQNPKSYISALALLLIFICCSLNSCKKDDDNTPPPTLITVVSGNMGINYDVLVTDADGNILAQDTIKPNTSVDLKSLKKYDKEAVNVFYRSVMLGSTVVGYLNIKKGFVLEFESFEYTPKNHVQLHIKPGAKFSKIIVSTDDHFKEITSYADTVSYMETSISPDREMFVQVEKNGGIFYKYYTIENVKNSDLWIDINEINTPMMKKDIVLPSNSTNCSSSITYKADPDDRQPYYGGHRSMYLDNRNSYEIYYPNTGPLQVDNCSISLSNNLNKNEGYNNNYVKRIPDKFEPLNFSCDLISSQPAQFKVAINGDIDFYHAYFYKGFNSMTIYVPAHIKEFKLPNFGQIFNDQNLNLPDLDLGSIRASKVPGFPKEEFINNYVKTQNPVTDMYDTQSKLITY